MHQARARVIGGAGDRLRALRLHGVEALPAFLIEDADQIDDRVGVAHRRLDRLREAHIGLHRMDLADAAERLQMAGQFRAADGDADQILAIGERAHQVAAEEARAAKDGDQRVGVVFHSHRRAGIQDRFCAV